MTTPQKALERFAEAVEAYALKGCGHPEDIPEIEREYEAARDELAALLALLPAGSYVFGKSRIATKQP